jgi:hypothetical protein
MKNLPKELIDVKILNNAIETLKGDLKRKDMKLLSDHIDQLGKLISLCEGHVEISWPDQDWKNHNGSVGNTGCNKHPIHLK